MSNVAVTCTNLVRLEEAKILAMQLNLPLCEIDSLTYSYQLVITENQLELHAKNNNYQPITIDFLRGKYHFRHEHTSRKNELLAKAVGIKANFKPYVIDSTAGLGRDGFLLGSLGCRVLMLERNSCLFALLKDALLRFNKNTSLAKNILLDVIHVDAKDYLTSLTKEDSPDVIFLDPMYPERQKSALVKKEMRILRDLIGDDFDAPDLLSLALRKAKKRVVVKRPRLAKTLSEQNPSLVFAGKSTRFDVYLM